MAISELRAAHEMQLRDIRHRLDSTEREVRRLQEQDTQRLAELAAANGALAELQRVNRSLLDHLANNTNAMQSVVDEFGGTRKHLMMSVDADRAKLREEKTRADEAEARNARMRKEHEDTVHALRMTISALRSTGGTKET